MDEARLELSKQTNMIDYVYTERLKTYDGLELRNLLELARLKRADAEPYLIKALDSPQSYNEVCSYICARGDS